MKPIAHSFTALCSLSLSLSLSLHASAAFAGGIALLPDGVLTAAERDAVHDALRSAGHAVLDDQEVLAAVDGARGACAHEDVPCLARIALLADADAAVSIARRGDDVDVVAADAGPRVGRATAPSSRAGQAVVDALAARAPYARVAGAPGDRAPVESAPVNSTPVDGAPVVDDAPVVDSGPVIDGAPVVDSAPIVERPTAAEPSVVETTNGPWALAGAGLAGAGLVALAAGGYAAALASGSMQQAEAAPFQDDSARLGDTANGQLWLSGSAFALGLGAMAGGAALIFLGGDP